MSFMPWKRIATGLSAFVLFLTICLLGVTSFPASSQAQDNCLTLGPGTIDLPIPASDLANSSIDVIEQSESKGRVDLYTALINAGPKACYYYDRSENTVKVDFKHKTLEVIPNPQAVSESASARKASLFDGSFISIFARDIYDDSELAKSYGIILVSNNALFNRLREAVLVLPGGSSGFGQVALLELQPDIAISPTMPADIIGGGTVGADLTQAAAFAWQEFIALNWPNEPLSNGTIQRETADASAVFGSSFSSSIDRPLVWETLRNKIEIFPSSGSNLYEKGIKALPDYDVLPDYANEYSESVPACSSAPSQDAWVNLDESNEISEANMFAGVVPTEGPVDPEGQKPGGAYTNQQFLYLAKGNRAEYDYVKDRQWNLGGTSFDTSKTETKDYITEDKRYEYPSLDETFTQDGKTYYYVSLPNGTDDTYGDVGTIELKSAWRQINSDEQEKFHTAPVRYYTQNADGKVCYEQPDAGAWGMAALHIIHKTPSAPYFIFATFSQADNILTEDGNPVENSDGSYKITPPATATTPDIKADTPGTPPAGTVYETPATKTQDQSFNYDPSSLPKEHESTDERLYYVNTGYPKTNGPPEPPETPIAVDKRQNDIPPEVIAVNQEAHDAISAYNKANGLSDSPWLHYKLVNVQWIPSTKAVPGPLYVKDSSKGQDLDPSTYYLANEVVETDFILQLFSGQFASDFTRITDFATTTQQQQGFADDSEQYLNVFHAGKGFNMGGCAGCHGNAANAGADFSFILKNAGGKVKPEDIGNAEAKKERIQQLLGDIVPAAAK